MDDFFALAKDKDDDYKCLLGACRTRDKPIQIAISVVFGLVAFLAFCILRPRWPGLYNARKKQKNEANVLPELPKSLFGWILPLWRITDQQVLASAGLDAYAFLAFFKMAMKFLVITLFFSLIVIKPVHDANPDDGDPRSPNITDPINYTRENEFLFGRTTYLESKNGSMPWMPEYFETDYLWMYVIFDYLFTTVALYLLVTETKKIIAVRQEYLGTQTSVTDRTIRLSGIPTELQDEVKIKEFVEILDIGKVESVTLCRNWKELDKAVLERMNILRRLEEAYTIHMGYRRVERNLESLPISQPPPPSPRGVSNPEEDGDERTALMGANGQPHVAPYERTRPKTSLRYGFLKLRSKKVDAIDYFEERLRQVDERIKELRQKSFDPVPLAFVTMDSAAACQMATQAVLDPAPTQLVANQSPAPVDVIWPNTYLSRRSRMLRAWSVTALIVLLTLFWSALLVPIATATQIEAIRKVFPQLADVLENHETIASLVNTQLPTLLASLLMILVSYIYYWLSWCQGMTSQGDVELSAISKNFFFTFVNFFVVFTVIGTVAQFVKFFQHFDKEFQKMAYNLALSLQQLLNFYVNFIILQGIGLFPFRLLQVGSMVTYCIFRIGAKTPRDYAELVQPPVFSYGFYLPNALLIFIICIVYSILRSSWQILLAGLFYFAFGHFVYKYQLLYAMDHQQQATGRAWGMMCDRVFIGLVVFQVTTWGLLVLKQAINGALLIVPLIIATIWISSVFGRTYKPLLRYIALRSVRTGEQYADYDSPPDATSEISELEPERNVWAETNDPQSNTSRRTRLGHRQRGVEHTGKSAVRFMNPSMVASLEDLWIADKSFRREDSGDLLNGDETV